MAAILTALATTGLLSLPVIYRESAYLHPIKGRAAVTQFSFDKDYSIVQYQIPYHPSSQVKKLQPNPPIFLSAVLIRPNKSHCILFCCGNGGNKRYHTSTVERLLEVFPHHSIMMFDYEGYGDSDGDKASLHGLFESTLTMYRFMKRNILSSTTEGLTVFAHSMGTGAACSILPYMQPQDRMILQNGFSSLKHMMQHWVPAPFSWLYESFVEDDFNNINQIKFRNEAHVPILAIHCRADEIVPFSIGQELGRYCDEFIPLTGTHNQPLYEENDEWTMRKFVKQIHS